VRGYAAIRSAAVLRCESTRGSVVPSLPPLLSPSLKLPMQRAERLSGMCAIPSAKLPMRFTEAIPGERASPSLKRPKRDHDGASGLRSMPSLNRRCRRAEGPSRLVGASWRAVMLPSLVSCGFIHGSV
jgi:hypothetical protein